MERTREQPEIKFPEIDPVLRQEVDAIKYTETERLWKYYAFDHEIVWYGVDAVFHVQFSRDALKVAEGEASLNDLISRYQLHKMDARDSKFFASLEPMKEAGIYVPPQRKITRTDLFTDDLINLCGSQASTFRLPPSTNKEIFRRNWSLEDFKDKELMKKALSVAKNLWAITVMNFELNKGARGDTPALPADAAQTVKKLIDYYWQIVEADDGHKSKPEQWLVHQRVKNPQTKYERRPQVFIGTKAELKKALALFSGVLDKSNPDPEILRVLRKNTRRQLVETLISENILKPEED